MATAEASVKGKKIRFGLIAAIPFLASEQEEYSFNEDVCPLSPTKELLIDDSESIQQEIIKNIDALIAAQEKRLGIKHFGKPALQFSLPYEVVQENPLSLLRFAGIYDDGTIYLNMSQPFDYLYAKEVLDHELGHFYTEKLSQSWGLGSWPIYAQDESGTDNNICLKLIDEGIAEYFGRVMNNGADTFKDANWPISLFGFREDYVIFDGGYHLVKPIIDAYGKEGIAYLVSNPPVAEELFFSPGYQQQALDDLAENECQLLFDGQTSPFF